MGSLQSHAETPLRYKKTTAKGSQVDTTQDGKPVVYDVVNMKDTPRVIYEGLLVDGKFHGEGRLYYLLGNYYDGDFLNGDRHGSGRVFNSMDEPIYQGKWSQDQPHDSAFKNSDSVVLPDSTVYRGSTLRGQPHGEGMILRGREVLFAGEYFEGRRHGNWFQVSNNDVFNARLVGTYKNGVLVSQKQKERTTGYNRTPVIVGGTTATKNQKHNSKVVRIDDDFIYEGEVNPKDGKPDGKGYLISPQGDVHEIFYKDGTQNTGTYTTWFANGDVYIGERQNLLPYNSGIYWKKQGDQYIKITGKWGQNQSGKGVIVYPDGSTYNGQFMNGLREGSGVFVEKDKGVIAGEWKNDKLVDNEQ